MSLSVDSGPVDEATYRVLPSESTSAFDRLRSSTATPVLVQFWVAMSNRMIRNFAFVVVLGSNRIPNQRLSGAVQSLLWFLSAVTSSPPGASAYEKSLNPTVTGVAAAASPLPIGASDARSSRVSNAARRAKRGRAEARWNGDIQGNPKTRGGK